MPTGRQPNSPAQTAVENLLAQDLVKLLAQPVTRVQFNTGERGRKRGEVGGHAIGPMESVRNGSYNRPMDRLGFRHSLRETAMYTPAAFKDNDTPRLHEQIEQTRLAILVTHGEDGVQATHLPLLLRPDQGAFGTLYGHLAKANPQVRQLNANTEAMVIFPGADAYISPAYYPSKAEHGKVVPTWNYLAVHAYGNAECFTDPERLRLLVGELTDRHESGRAQPWSINDAPADYIASMLGAIVGFALPVQRLQGKRKLSQNRDARDIAGVRDGLAASAELNDQQIARLMS
ncbi:Transcriptional regulator [Pseudomonas cannabina]|uniref:Transcriptional regulator n=3 Tax=Pseudomonas syringae group TaxID=136849 RepID=A0A3M3QCR3_PSECA|nr:Transcriptional regulator [Pseudomonas cannabina pv. alisalensis]RMN81693.1 Transcriptional regulator [Pseudomonas cannabina]RMO00495.1 Transcriptional regulator [Pseudomonas cannabina]